MKIKIAINGFGRIGRSFFRAAHAEGAFDIVAINDLGDPENLAYLLEYDTVYGKSVFPVSVNRTGNRTMLVIDGREAEFLQRKNPAELPWRDMDVDVVVEATGVFTNPEGARAHIYAGAKRVVVTAPFKEDDNFTGSAETILVGVNEDKFGGSVVTSNASCTTNAASPLMAILDEALGIEKAMLNTVHGYTASQALVDGQNKKDFRRGRAAAANIVPTTTGASEAVARALPKFKDTFSGIALRVPVVSGSVVDVTFLAKQETTEEEVNDILRRAAEDERWKKVFAVTEEPVVSSDIIGSTYASIADLDFTRVVGGNLVKVLAWYDNEMGYVHALVEHVRLAGENI